MEGMVRWFVLGVMLTSASLLAGCYESHPVDGGDCVGLCVSDTITWGYVGGLAATTDESQLTTCRTFQHTRTDVSGGGGTLSCSETLPACASNASVSVEEVQSALNDPDVLAALDAAPVLYGRDPRPVDGQVFEITVGDAVIDVGDLCAGDPGCVVIPEGVQTLVDVLSSLTMTEISQEPCLSILLGE